VAYLWPADNENTHLFSPRAAASAARGGSAALAWPRRRHRRRDGSWKCNVISGNIVMQPWHQPYCDGVAMKSGNVEGGSQLMCMAAQSASAALAAKAAARRHLARHRSADHAAAGGVGVVAREGKSLPSAAWRILILYRRWPCGIFTCAFILAPRLAIFPLSGGGGAAAARRAKRASKWHHLVAAAKTMRRRKYQRQASALERISAKMAGWHLQKWRLAGNGNGWQQLKAAWPSGEAGLSINIEISMANI